MRRWWSDKYGKSPDDPKFSRLTYAEILLDFFEDLFRQKVEIEARIRESTGSDLVELHERLSIINEALSNERERMAIGALGSGATGDPLVDRWLLELEEGRTPDLYEGLTEDMIKKL